MIVDFNHNELDDAIDERITKAFDIWDRYGKEAFDEDYRLVPREVYDLQECHLLSIIQEQQEQIRELSEYYHGTVVSQINKLWKEVEKL
tara:strand:+ start:320 stop:586 length:267 start_codon:yes stop_codon:yes gene_type:complete